MNFPLTSAVFSAFNELWIPRPRIIRGWLFITNPQVDREEGADLWLSTNVLMWPRAVIYLLALFTSKITQIFLDFKIKLIPKPENVFLLSDFLTFTNLSKIELNKTFCSKTFYSCKSLEPISKQVMPFHFYCTFFHYTQFVERDNVYSFLLISKQKKVHDLTQ